jgi:hypothetical protein
MGRLFRGREHVVERRLIPQKSSTCANRARPHHLLLWTDRPRVETGHQALQLPSQL